MKWEEFVSNVQQWSKDRGIYEHSTAVAQALKACSEAGELCDAVIKGDREALVDAVGDVAVCLVNVQAMTDVSLDMAYIFDDEMPVVDMHKCAAMIAKAVGEVCYSSARGNKCEPVSDSLDAAFYGLYATCLVAELDFLHCCESAWDEIKDRKGRMVPGGAFVKEEA